MSNLVGDHPFVLDGPATNDGQLRRSDDGINNECKPRHKNLVTNLWT